MDSRTLDDEGCRRVNRHCRCIGAVVQKPEPIRRAESVSAIRIDREGVARADNVTTEVEFTPEHMDQLIDGMTVGRRPVGRRP